MLEGLPNRTVSLSGSRNLPDVVIKTVSDSTTVLAKKYIITHKEFPLSPQRPVAASRVEPRNTIYTVVISSSPAGNLQESNTGPDHIPGEDLEQDKIWGQLVGRRKYGVHACIACPRMKLFWATPSGITIAAPTRPDTSKHAATIPSKPADRH